MQVTDDQIQRFGGVERLYGRGAIKRLGRSHVCVVGLGGVGSWVVEALARSGLGALTLVDLDDVCVTNINRQLPALEDTIGRPKARVLAERVAQISPHCVVQVEEAFFTASTSHELLAANRYDYVVDAIDSLSNKCLLIARTRDLGMPIVTCGGAGGRRDPSQVRVDDLAFATRDQLLKYVRKRLRGQYGFPRDPKQPFQVRSVFSTERPVFPWSDGSVCEEPEDGAETAINCASGLGTAGYLTGAYGFAAASIVVGALASGSGLDREAGTGPKSTDK